MPCARTCRSRPVGRSEVALPLHYKGREVGCGYRLDLLVENAVVVEVKAVERFESVHQAQLLAYLKLSGKNVGLLLNFNVKWLAAQGLKRVVLDFDESLRGLGVLGGKRLR